jgi:hypothetical protein
VSHLGQVSSEGSTGMPQSGLVQSTVGTEFAMGCDLQMV